MLKAYILTLREVNDPALQAKVRALSVLGDIEVVQGLDGRALAATEYYSTIAAAYARHGLLLSPAEVGCTLSHLAIYRKFLQSAAPTALIFEDDVQVGARSFTLLRRALALLGPEDILIAGGQEGLEQLGPIRGSRLEADIFQVHKDSWTHVKRTCAYAVSRETAMYILEVQSAGLWMVDDYRVLCPPHGRLLFCKAFAHPSSEDDSTLAPERAIKRNPARPRRLAARLAYEVGRSIAPQMLRWKGRLFGHLDCYRVIEK